MKILISALILLFAFAQSDKRKANEAYHQGDYVKAAELYRQALQNNPNDAQLHFNLGNTLAKMGRTEDAIESYERFKSLTDDPGQQALADYNIGNLFSEEEDLGKAAEYYRRSLQNAPEDEDARHNYELSLRQQQQQQQQQQNQNQDQDEDQDEEQNQQQQQPDQDQQDQDQEQDQQQQPRQQDPEDDSSSMDRPEPEMSLEEAESILDALEQRERELLRDRKKEAEDEPSSNEKDW